MPRRFIHWVGILIILAGALAWAAAVPRAEQPRPGNEETKAKPRSEHPAVAIARKLSQKAPFAGFEDPKTTLGDALETLTKLYTVPFEINEKAFKADNLQDLDKTEIAGTPIPALNQAPLERVLRKLLPRVPASSGACFVVRKDHIEITTGAARQAEFWPNGSENVPPNPASADAAPQQMLPLVVIEFDRLPLDEALRELANAAGHSIVLDAKVAEKSKTAVTASLINVPLDTAVRMLADMADLRPVLLNAAIYVTTENRADRFQPGAAYPIPGAAQPGGMGALPQGVGMLGFGGGLLGVGFMGGLAQPAPFAHATRVRIDNKPLGAALKEITDGRPVQVVLDRERIGQRGSKPVTADLERVSMQTGIRLLTDMADLSTVFIDNVAYVTTRDNARQFHEETPPVKPALPPPAAPPPAPPMPAPAEKK